MRLITFKHGGSTRAGLLRGQPGDPNAVVVDLATAEISRCLEGVEPTVDAMLRAGLDVVAEQLSTSPPAAESQLPFGEVELLAPLPRPRRIIGIAHNYRCALAERRMELPRAPVAFEKKPSTVIAPGAAIILPFGAGGITYEAELAAIIGLRADGVSPERALDHVAGYTIFNDVSASEIIRADGDFERGKNFPTFGPMGPYLATPDEVGDPSALRITLSVDGQVLQSGSTSDMLFGVAELISLLSHERPLEVGDVIATGTPAGVAPLRSPPAWLRSGSQASVTVAGLGTLANPVENEVPAHV